jgi:hypothetical protein
MKYSIRSHFCSQKFVNGRRFILAALHIPCLSARTHLINNFGASFEECGCQRKDQRLAGALSGASSNTWAGGQAAHNDAFGCRQFSTPLTSDNVHAKYHIRFAPSDLVQSLGWLLASSHFEIRQTPQLELRDASLMRGIASHPNKKQSKQHTLFSPAKLSSKTRVTETKRRGETHDQRRHPKFAKGRRNGGGVDSHPRRQPTRALFPFASTVLWLQMMKQGAMQK